MISMADDERASAIIDLLRLRGADEMPHRRGRSLLDHLVGTYAIARRWELPSWLQHAALIHSVYGTDAYRPALLPRSARGEVAAVAGDRAERLAYLFGVTPRASLVKGASADLAQAEDLGGTSALGEAEDLEALVVLHVANLAEQATADDGSPGSWLADAAVLAARISNSARLAPPPFLPRLAAFTEVDESLARRAYRDAVGRGDDPEARTSRFALVASVCPVVAEPCVWLAYLALCTGDDAACASWAAQARSRLRELGTAWDQRLAFEEWTALIDALEHPGEEHAADALKSIAHPRPLFENVTGIGHGKPEATSPRQAKPRTAPDPATGGRRFRRYVQSLAGADGGRSAAVYPDLPSQPWHDPAGFPLVAYLESNYSAIRNELLALEGARFQRESEPIKRIGDWDVVFLYERGRRHDDVCALCPVTTHGVESHRTLRTAAGLIYVSRMRGSTHIASHRGPTNLRVRCHLGIAIPDGDCAIRVGRETRRWEEGRCLVFDDYFQHEAWNNTNEDRLVLIADLWHPGLSSTEVTLLEGLQNYAYDYARRLSRYWSANAAARQAPRGRP